MNLLTLKMSLAKIGILSTLLVILLAVIRWLIRLKIYISKLKRVKLSNGLDALIVQNPNFKTSVIKVQIKAGNIYNPADAPGLASLLKNVMLQGSTKYSKRGSLQSHTQSSYGCTTASASKEMIQIELQISDLDLKSGADMLAWSITSPLFEKDLIEEEINICDEFSKHLNTDEYYVSEDLITSIIDPAFPEHRFFRGNKESLSIPDIDTKLKEFHSKYVTADRINLVICSKCPMEELKGVLKIFETLPKKNTSIIPPLHLNFSPKFSGCIVEYTNTENYGKLEVIIKCKDLSKLADYKPIDYLSRLFRREKTNSLKKRLLGMIEDDIFLHFFNIDENFFLELSLTLSVVGTSKINFIVQEIHTFISQQVPMKSVFDEVREEALDLDALVGKDELEASDVMINTLEDYPFSITKDDNYKFDEKILKDILDTVSNINNWVVLISTPETGFSNEIKYSNLQYKDPVKINLTTDFTLDNNKKSQLQKEFEKTFIQNRNDFNLVPTNQFFSELSREEYKNGDFTLLSCSLSNDIYEIGLSLYVNFDSKHIIGNLLYINAFLDQFENVVKGTGISYCSFQARMYFSLQGRRANILKDFRKFFGSLRTIKPTDEEILTAKTIMKKEHSEYYSKSPISDSLIALRHALRNLPYLNDANYDDSIDKAESLPLPEWYISLAMIGNISVQEARALYDIIKSTGTKELAKVAPNIDRKRIIKRSDPHNNTYLMSYEVSYAPENIENKLIWQNALGSIVAKILLNPFYNYLRSENPISYVNSVDKSLFFDQIFLTFFVKSSENIEEVERAMLSFKTKAEKILDEISDSDLENIKKGITGSLKNPKNELLINADLVENMKTYNIDSFNYADILITSISSITKDDLKKANIFAAEPIIIHTDDTVIED